MFLIILNAHPNELVVAEGTKGKVATESSDLVARGNDICNVSYGEEITGEEMDVDPSSICISPPRLHSVDEVVSSSVFSESRQRSLFNREIEGLSPADDARTNPTGFEDDILNRNSQENTIDEDMNIPSSTMEFVEQCTVTHPDGYHSHDIEPTVICKTSDDNTVYTKAAPSASMPVESQVVEVAETPGVITENDRMETENKNGSTNKHPSAADDAANLDGPCDKLVNASDCSRDSKAVGNMMVVQ